jgi:urea transport system substrate-binding protein
VSVNSQTCTCPNDEQLTLLLAGELPPAEVSRLVLHVTECQRCRDSIRAAGFSVGSLKAIQTSDDTLTGAHNPAQNSAIGTGTVLPAITPAMPAAQTNGSPSVAAQMALAPPQGPDELGRLGGYRILRVLGEGGMGVVFEAEDISLRRRVAIKVLRAGEIDTSQRKRFLQEAQLAASLTSDRIVTVHQVGEHDGCLFIVMQLLCGESLEARLKTHRWLPLVEALRIAREVAEGLAVAHEKQLVHRDIKPANVWLESKRSDDSAQRVKLLDFGVARSIAVHEHLTIGGNIVGTPCYMSPEQACGLPVDERSDLFSLGCLLYAMLAGKSPFERGNYIQTLKAVVDERPQPLAEALPGLPAPVATLVDRLLEKTVAARPANAQQVVQEIRRIEEGLTTAGLVMPAATTISAMSPHRIRQRLGWGVWIGALAILAAALLGGWGEYRRLKDRAANDAQERAMSATLATVAPPQSDAKPGAGTTKPAEKSPPPADDGSQEDANPSANMTSDGSSEETAESAVAANPDLPTIKIGILHSLSGAMAASERPIVDAFIMAVQEINEQGGLLGGRMIEAVVRDGKSSERVFAEQAEDLITNEEVVTLFGCWRSPCRKLVEEVCRRHEHLLVFPTAYEGIEESPYVIYMGGAPNQQIMPAVKYAFAYLGKRKFFLVGVDGIYSRTVHEIIRDELNLLGGEVVGESFRPHGSIDFSAVAQSVIDSQADVVMNTVSGIGNVGLFNCLRQAGILADEIPTISFRVTEEELQSIAGDENDVAGDYAAWSYFETLETQNNFDFLERLRARYGPSRVATDPMATAYASLYLWADAVYESESDDVADIRREIVNQSMDAPEGKLAIDAVNRHSKRRAMIGQVNDQMQFDIVWTSPKAIPPEPFPASRSRDEWLKFQRDLYKRWGGQWRPDAPRK